MTLLEETLNKVVRDMINSILDIPDFAIKAKQNAPRPSGSYASVDVSATKHVGWEESNFTNRMADPDLDETITGHREVMCSLQFYRSSAVDNGNAVRTGMIRTSIRDTLRASNLGIISRTEVREISEQLENGWEERAQLDIVLSAVGTDIDIVTSIEAAVVSGDFQTRGKQIPLTIEV